MGSILSPDQEDLLAVHAKLITLMLDQDDAGRKAVEEMLPRLARKCFVRVLTLPSEGARPATLETEDLIKLLGEPYKNYLTA